jgi:serine/threonine-protein kinase HipA
VLPTDDAVSHVAAAEQAATSFLALAFTKGGSFFAINRLSIAKWRETGKALSMTARDLAQFADAFEHPERAAAQKIVGTKRR